LVILSLVLTFICFFHFVKILINQKITFKGMEDSLGKAATDKSVIAMVSITLALLGLSFLAICVGIYFFTFAATE